VGAGGRRVVVVGVVTGTLEVTVAPSAASEVSGVSFSEHAAAMRHTATTRDALRMPWDYHSGGAKRLMFTHPRGIESVRPAHSSVHLFGRIMKRSSVGDER
jgi:hypothetical protein